MKFNSYLKRTYISLSISFLLFISITIINCELLEDGSENDNDKNMLNGTWELSERYNPITEESTFHENSYCLFSDGTWRSYIYNDPIHPGEFYYCSKEDVYYYINDNQIIIYDYDESTENIILTFVINNNELKIDYVYGAYDIYIRADYSVIAEAIEDCTEY